MPTLDVFKADAFSLASLTEAILKAPFKPGRLGALGLFRERGITTTVVQVEEKDGQLSLIATSARGSVPDTLGAAKRKVRSFTVPHLAREATIMADEVQNVRAFGSENTEEAVQTIVNERLMELRAQHEVTLEHLRVGALRGKILDADGATILDLFSAAGFDVVQQTLDIDLTTASTEVRNRCVAIARLIEDELGGDMYTGLRGFAGKDFFDALVKHAEVKKTYEHQEGFLLRQDWRAGFVFGGITWEEYRGKVSNQTFVPDAEAVVFPEGTRSFVTHFSPADFAETVNTIGLPIYAKQAPDLEFNRWVRLHTQSNPLPLCLRPRVVIRVTKS